MAKNSSNCTYIEDTRELSLIELRDIYTQAYNQGYRDAESNYTEGCVVISVLKKNPPLALIQFKTAFIQG